MQLLFIIGFAIFLLTILTFLYGSFIGAPFVPTRKKDVVNFTGLAKIKEGDRVVDLGCGDGRLLFACAKKGAFACGYEVALLPYLIAKIKKVFFKEKERVRIVYGDFWKSDLKDVDVVYFFLMPDIYQKIKKKIDREAKKGTKIICYVWPMEGWDLLEKRGGKDSLRTFLYQI